MIGYEFRERLLFCSAKSIWILVIFFALVNTGVGQDDWSKSEICSNNVFKKKWDEIGSDIATGNHSKVIPFLKEMLLCESIQDNASPKVDLEHITGAKAYLIRSYLKLGDLDSVKYYLDGLNTNLASYDENVFFLKLHYKMMGFFYGEYYVEKGYYELAASHYENTIDDIFEDINYEANGSLDKEVVYEIYWLSALDLFNNAALVQARIGNYGKANLYFNIALIFSDPDNMWQLAAVHQNLAWSYSKIGEYSLAKKHFATVERILKNDKKNKDNIYTSGIAYKNKAEYHYKIGEIDSAFLYLNKSESLEIENETRVFNNQLYAQILIKEKRFDEAKKKINTAKKYTSLSQGKTHPEMAENYQLEADLYHAIKKYDEADKRYDKALGILTRQATCNCKNIVIKDIIEKRMAMGIIRNKAKNFFLMGGDNEWRNCYLKLNELTQELNNKYILSESSKYNLVQEAKKFYAEAIEAFVIKEDYEKAYEFSLLAKGMVLLQQIQDKKAIEADFIPEAAVEKGKSLKFKINELYKIKDKAFFDNNKELTENIEKEIVTIENRHEKWIDAIEKEYPAYYELKYDNRIESLKDIQAEITGKNTTILEYFLGESQLYLFIVNSKNIEVEILDLYDDFQTDILRFHQIISNNTYDNTSFREFTRISHQLYETLIGKVDTNIIEKNLIIIPDEEINLIPFEALITEPFIPNTDQIEYNELNYLLESYTVSYQYSSNLIPNHDNEKIEKRFLGIAPSFNNKNIAPLLYNEKEINSIQHSIGGEVLLNVDATYAKFKEKLNDSNIIHLATHAVFNDEIPLDSRIELTDTSLYIYELVALKHNLDLVVLSACETASGKRLKGEGVISLSRALVQSGCPTVISSLWEVSDQKAERLMSNFYSHFAEEVKSNESLTLAKREFLNGTISRNTHPFYWAGFIHIGKPLKCSGTNDYSFLYWSIPLGLLIIILLFRKIKL